MLRFIDNSDLTDDTKMKIRSGVCAQLRQTWEWKRVDRAFVQSLHDSFPDELVGKLDTADRLAPLMIGATGISGNPRLIKRFLNALAIRMTISKARSEEHTSELQSLMRISYAVFCLKKQKTQ